MEAPKAPPVALDLREVMEDYDRREWRAERAESLPGRSPGAQKWHELEHHYDPFATCDRGRCYDAAAENLANARRFARAYQKEENDGRD